MTASQDRREHHRHSIRLKGYDYSQGGAYFVTIVAFQRACLFGEVVDGEMRLNRAGEVAAECWLEIPAHFTDVELGGWVVMPNHVHGIVIIRGPNGIQTATSPSPSAVGARHASPLRPRGAPARSLGAIIGSFKAAVTKRIGRELGGQPIWQRNYYEHIIRNERQMRNTWLYIASNPLRWAADDQNPHPANPG